LIDSLKNIPYGEVVEVEQELMHEGLQQDEVLKLCDVHSAVLDGNVDLSDAKTIPEGHPVDLFMHENSELKKVADKATDLLRSLQMIPNDQFVQHLFALQGCFNQLMDFIVLILITRY
jgi:DUF438 domain-containing protein